MSLPFEMVSSVAGLIAAPIAVNWIWRWWTEAVRARRITSLNDRDVSPSLELYSKSFSEKDGEYPAESMEQIFHMNWDGSEHHVNTLNIALAAKFRRSVVGILWAHYYPKKERVMVSYFAIDHDVKEARQDAADKLVGLLSKIIKRQHPECKQIVFEVDAPDATKDDAERRRRSARLLLFKRSAKAHNFVPKEIDYLFIAPRPTLAPTSKTSKRVITIIDLDSQVQGELLKSQMAEVLDFIYFCCYGDMYGVQDPLFQKYHAYLKQDYDSIVRKLPETLTLK